MLYVHRSHIQLIRDGSKVYLCSCIILCYFTGNFYAVVRQISMLFIDNKDPVFCILTASLSCFLWRKCAGRRGLRCAPCRHLPS